MVYEGKYRKKKIIVLHSVTYIKICKNRDALITGSLTLCVRRTPCTPENSYIPIFLSQNSLRKRSMD